MLLGGQNEVTGYYSAEIAFVSFSVFYTKGSWQACSVTCN